MRALHPPGATGHCPSIQVTQTTTISCGSVFRVRVTRVNGSFVPGFVSHRSFVFNEICSFVPKKIFGGHFQSKSSSNMLLLFCQSQPVRSQALILTSRPLSKPNPIVSRPQPIVVA